MPPLLDAATTVNNNKSAVSTTKNRAPSNSSCTGGSTDAKLTAGNKTTTTNSTHHKTTTLNVKSVYGGHGVRYSQTSTGARLNSVLNAVAASSNQKTTKHQHQPSTTNLPFSPPTNSSRVSSKAQLITSSNFEMQRQCAATP